ncbi:MAG: response regulator NasT [Gallionellaceae bacterium]|nr:MAG: response regulator NasT [Gallionellaceae bacterium]
MGETILLVEDDRLVLHTLARGLREAGYQVLEADSGEVAIQLCSTNDPDLALLDMRLGGMSGIEFAQWLKGALGVPFLFLSAYNDSDTVVAAAELGALGYLVKPLDVPQVLPAIRTALQRAQEIKKLHQAELDLSTALKTSRSISMAIGLLMQRFDSGADETFEALRAYCRSNRVRMVDLANQVVEHKQNVDLSSYLKKS